MIKDNLPPDLIKSDMYLNNAEQASPLVKKQLSYEQKMLKKGYRYIQDLTQHIPTWLFVSPQKYEIIQQANKDYKAKIKSDRQNAYELQKLQESFTKQVNDYQNENTFDKTEPHRV